MAKSEIRNTPNLVRISPRIPRKLSVVAKYIYAIKGVTLEDRVALLIQKDIDDLVTQKWYKEHLDKMEVEERELNNLMKYMVTGKRSSSKEKFYTDPLTDGEE